MRSIDVIIRELCKAVTEGKQKRYISKGGEADAGEAEGDAPQRRSSRARYRADDAAGASGEPDNADRQTQPASADS
jgi:hypothetical protein